jgi:polyisoprenoid-binding protein YceI
MLSIRGELTIRDKSREVVLDVTEVDRSRSPQGDEVIYYVAETSLNRFDFGVNGWRGVVGPRLKVVINVQANRED